MEGRQNLARYSYPEMPLAVPSALERRYIAPQQLSINDLCRTLARRKGLILSFAALALAGAAAYAFFSTPIYEGVARLQIDPTRSTSLGLEDDRNKAAYTDTDGRIKTEVNIIQSDTVATKVMNALQLYRD